MKRGIGGAEHAARVAAGVEHAVMRRRVFAPVPDDLDFSRIVQVASLPAGVRRDARGRGRVEFEFDPGTPGRGSGWEITRVTLH